MSRRTERDILYLAAMLCCHSPKRESVINHPNKAILSI